MTGGVQTERLPNPLTRHRTLRQFAPDSLCGRHSDALSARRVMLFSSRRSSLLSGTHGRATPVAAGLPVGGWTGSLAQPSTGNGQRVDSCSLNRQDIYSSHGALREVRMRSSLTDRVSHGRPPTRRPRMPRCQATRPVRHGDADVAICGQARQAAPGGSGGHVPPSAGR
jgi:hypothetical protein